MKSAHHKSPRSKAFLRYLAYHNYVDALARLIHTSYPASEDIVQALLDNHGFQRFRRSVPAGLGDIGQSLRHAWYTELMMLSTLHSASAFPYVVSWSMVHAYYAINRGMNTYFLASTDAIPTSHNGMIHALSSYLMSKHNPFPLPWRAVLEGDPTQTTVTLTNGPEDLLITLTNPMKSHEDPWQNIGLLLRTTRKRQLEESIINWKHKRRTNRIPKAQRDRLLNKMVPTSLFDALYRMRRRSNYQDTDSFIFCNVPVDDTIHMHRSLLAFVSASLMVFECLVARVTPRDWLTDTVENFVDASGALANETINARWPIINELVSPQK